MILHKQSWFLFPQHNEMATKRLFCFHYAGGNAHIFYPWAKHLDPSIELISVQLPGHGTRFTEPLFTSMDPLIDNLGTQIVDYLDRPYFFFGHSLGGLIAYALTHYMQRNSLPLPDCLFVSGKTPPHFKTSDKISHLPDLDFLEEVKKYNGLPEEILQNQELVEIWLPILRADFQILETFIRPDDYKLSCDLMALGGVNDIMVTPSRVELWQDYTTACFKALFFPGDHFFINPQQTQVIEMISKVMHERTLL
ncbi:MAG: hypothetical protein BGO77_01000 [Caedibacter sp. 37-49]|nr:MAG: hypothetical protein BGO77_01000 [Caedibacter sp. 37-49]